MIPQGGVQQLRFDEKKVVPMKSEFGESRTRKFNDDIVRKKKSENK